MASLQEESEEIEQTEAEENVEDNDAEQHEPEQDVEMAETSQTEEADAEADVSTNQASSHDPVVDRLAEIDAVLDAKEEERKPKSQAEIISADLDALIDETVVVHVDVKEKQEPEKQVEATEESAVGEKRKHEEDDEESAKKPKVEETETFEEDILNDVDVDDLEIIDMLDQSDEDTLILQNLAEDVCNQDLIDFFMEVGVQLNRIRIAEGKNAPIQIGCVKLTNKEDKEKAMSLNSTELNDEIVEISLGRPTISRKKRAMLPRSFTGHNHDDSVTLFIKNLPHGANSKMLEEHFEGCLEARVPLKEGGRNKGFAFVEFESIIEMEKAMTEKQGAEFLGKKLLLDYMGARAMRPELPSEWETRGRRDDGEDRSSRAVLYVKNLSFDTTKDILADYFETCVDARVATFRDTGNPRGFGFVEFINEEAAQEALEKMNGKRIDGRPIYVDFANDPKESGGSNKTSCYEDDGRRKRPRDDRRRDRRDSFRDRDRDRDRRGYGGGGGYGGRDGGGGGYGGGGGGRNSRVGIGGIVHGKGGGGYGGGKNKGKRWGGGGGGGGRW